MKNSGNYKSRKFWYWIGGVLGGLIVLLGIGALVISAKWKPTLTTKLKEGVTQASEGLYRLDFKDIHLNVLTGTAVLDSISLTPDTAVFTKLKTAKEAPTHLFRIQLAHLKISRVGILTAYFKKKVNLTAIILDHPSIDMVYHKVPKKTDTVKDNRTLYQQISKSLKSISVAQIKVVDADFDYYNGNKKLNSVKNLNVTVKDILIDSAAQFDTTRVFHSKNIGFELLGYKSVTKDKMYTLKIDTVQGSVTGKDLEIRGLQMIPTYEKIPFSKKYKYQTERYALNFRQVNFSGVDYVGLNNNGELLVKQMEIGSATADIFMNREAQATTADKWHNFPHIALRRIPIPTIIERLKIRKVNVAYGEYNPQTKEIGTIKLDGLNGVITNLTNDSSRLITNNHAYADLTTYVMGAAKLNVKIDFNLTAANAAFHYKGTVGSFDLKALNPISKPLGQIAIETGKVNSISFDISANRSGANGKVNFFYNDLKIQLLGKTDEGKTKKKGLLSFLANTILVKDANIKGEKGRVAVVTHEREGPASFFNLMWKTIFKGMREIVGVGIVPMK